MDAFARPSLVVALDFPDAGAALGAAGELRGIAPWCKVGLELFTIAGPALIEKLRGMDYRVFLDLKFHDIPHTVGRAVRAASAAGADMLTIHCQGGRRMCEAAVDAVCGLAAQERPLVMGVTALTSLSDGEIPVIAAPVRDFALQLAAHAQEWRLDGVVCSGHEAAAIRSMFPSLMLVCPGIRPKGSSADDQARTVTPAMAVEAGADFLVIGRPILEAPSRAKAAEAILEDIRKARGRG